MTQCILNTGRNLLKILLLILILSNSTIFSRGTVLSGLDVLESTDFSQLKNRRVAIVANATSVNRNGTGIISLFQSNRINLVKIFSPEHGFSTTHDEKVGNSTIGTIPVISLYGKSKKLDPAELNNIDVVIFDIQSVGARYYTYIATMVYTLQACKSSKTEVFVLDRPNPSGGSIISGFIPPSSLTGYFTSIYPIPTRHGMTIGELAVMLNKKMEINASLTVIKMKNWKRSMLYSDTGLPWNNPSPNIQTEEAAILYTGLGWLETTALSMGRGTKLAFEQVGAPYINATKLASAVSEVDGFTILPVTFTPKAKYHKFYNQKCNGISITIHNKKEADAFELSLMIYKHLVKTYPAKYTDYAGLSVSAGKKNLRSLILNRSIKSIIKDNSSNLKKFYASRNEFLLYE
jgi:uncharacterized protein YbbC (DUF1343 family)